MEIALNYLLTGVLDIAHNVSVHIMDAKVEVKINGPKMSFENNWYYKCIAARSPRSLQRWWQRL